MWKEFLQKFTVMPQSTLEEQQIITGSHIIFKIIDDLLSNHNKKITADEN